MAVVDLLLEVTATPDCGIPASFPSRALKVILPSCPSIINNVPSILHMSWVSSGVSLSLAISGVLDRIADRLGSIRVGHQYVYSLQLLTLAFKVLS